MVLSTETAPEGHEVTVDPAAEPGGPWRVGRVVSGLPGPVRTAFAALLGLVAASLLLLLLGADPIEAWSGITRGSVGDATAVTNTLAQMVPVALIAIGVTVSFRAGLWNAGGEGQFLVGAVAGGVFAIQVSLPSGLHVVATLLVAAVAGSAFSFLAGVLRERRGASEILTTLMLNFVGALLVSWVISGSLSATFTPSTVPILPTAELSPIVVGGDRVHPGIVVVLLLALVVGLSLRWTRFGLSVRSVGANPTAAELAGLGVRATRLGVFALAGALAGLSGGLQVAAVHHAVVDGMSPSYGFTAIVAALLGGLTIRGSLVASFGMSALLVGGQALQRSSDLTLSAVYVIQGALLVTLIAAQVIGRTAKGWR